ncbi:glucosaminidase domain-containing protein [Brachybacterium sp. EF45031]|uniref:golvesin C-terminal-like domain-containing protein n=1 Tax=Brachybacterium sillae TaxID=2810536 RepID=UPI00217D7BAE|nr:glucosaminidase domain-containing protein [Brachybacterium sillae]MCS6712330.1 glucosaminidase domain-containing protein [Brachybacterium sillae]
MTISRRSLIPLTAAALAAPAVAAPLAQAVVDNCGRDLPAITAADQQAFFTRVPPWAQAERARYRVPVSVAMGQAGLESYFGRTEIARVAHNLHGIKALRSNVHAVGQRDFLTGDWVNGEMVCRLQPFQVFATEAESFLGHGAFLQHTNYSAAFRYTDDPYRFLVEVDKGGYGGTGDYADRVWAFITKHGLTRYDALTGGTSPAPSTFSAVVTTQWQSFTASSNWGTSSWGTQKRGSSYRYASPAKVSDVAWFSANLPAAGRYRIEVWYPAASGYNTQTPGLIPASTGQVSVTLDQTRNGGVWRDLGTHSFGAGTRLLFGVSRWSAAPGYVVADAIRVTRVA